MSPYDLSKKQELLIDIKGSTMKVIIYSHSVQCAQMLRRSAHEVNAQRHWH
jgi:hypothetical protein